MTAFEAARQEEQARLEAYQRLAMEQVDHYAAKQGLSPDEHQDLRGMLGGAEDMRVKDLDVPPDR